MCSHHMVRFLAALYGSIVRKIFWGDRLSRRRHDTIAWRHCRPCQARRTNGSPCCDRAKRGSLYCHAHESRPRQLWSPCRSSRCGADHAGLFRHIRQARIERDFGHRLPRNHPHCRRDRKRERGCAAALGGWRAPALTVARNARVTSSARRRWTWQRSSRHANRPSETHIARLKNRPNRWCPPPWPAAPDLASRPGDFVLRQRLAVVAHGRAN